MFEKASRLKLRYDTPQGTLSTEDLWDLPLTVRTGSGRANLDDLARSLDKQIKETGEVVSYVDETRTSDEKLQLRFDIVLHIIKARKAENQTLLESQTRATQKQQLLALIVQKKNESLTGKSLEELQAMVNAL